jgi:hypothetical protein
MTDFSEKAAEIAAESLFTKTQLEKLFNNDKERDKFVQIRSIIKESTSINNATKDIIDLGDDAVKILVKIGKKVLLG